MKEKVLEDNRENILIVEMDWGSTPLWGKSDNGSIANYSDYAWLRLPSWLEDRMIFWTAWHDSFVPEKPEEAGWNDWMAYGLSIAIDIKRNVGNKYVVYYGREREIEIPLCNVQ